MIREKKTRDSNDNKEETTDEEEEDEDVAISPEDKMKTYSHSEEQDLDPGFL